MDNVIFQKEFKELENGKKERVWPVKVSLLAKECPRREKHKLTIQAIIKMKHLRFSKVVTVEPSAQAYLSTNPQFQIPNP